MEPKDTSTRHFKLSLVKSSLRIVAGIFLMNGWIFEAGMFFAVAECVGIAEEM